MSACVRLRRFKQKSEKRVYDCAQKDNLAGGELALLFYNKLAASSCGHGCGNPPFFKLFIFNTYA
jgi:hypothetical protein